MNEKENNQPTIIFNAPIYNNGGGTLTGNVVNNYYGTDSNNKPKSRSTIKAALETLMTARDHDNQLIFTKSYQWYGVMRVLAEYCDYPMAAKDFEKAIASLNLTNVNYPCKYDSFRKVPTECSRLAKPNVYLWKSYKTSSQGKELEVINAALTLMQLLELEKE